jgi:hypothetical protein
LKCLKYTHSKKVFSGNGEPQPKTSELELFTTILANQLNHFILPMFPKCIEDVEDLYESIKG